MVCFKVRDGGILTTHSLLVFECTVFQWCVWNQHHPLGLAKEQDKALLGCFAEWSLLYGVQSICLDSPSLSDEWQLLDFALDLSANWDGFQIYLLKVGSFLNERQGHSSMTWIWHELWQCSFSLCRAKYRPIHEHHCKLQDCGCPRVSPKKLLFIQCKGFGCFITEPTPTISAVSV